ncbi:MAG TPA: adenylyl-sulfate kinase [Solirubrobacteraceae bacterium]|nr:adenylyl-sulfate kinase [Solirubrobacteraceae bacterium]
MRGGQQQHHQPIPDGGMLTREQRWGALEQRGMTVWFTGLPAAGKTTLAAAVEERLVLAGRSAYHVDGDRLRTGLSADLGFGEQARNENVRRAAEVARMLADGGAVALVSLVSPYAAARLRARELHERSDLRFLEVFLATPLRECERRDPKGLYARARRGELQGMTGVDDPYEPPRAAELELPGDDTLASSVAQVIELVAASEHVWPVATPSQSPVEPPSTAQLLWAEGSWFGGEAGYGAAV